MSQFDFKASAITAADVGDKTTTITTTTHTTVTMETLGSQAGLTPAELDSVKGEIQTFIEAHEKKDKERMVEAGYEMVGKIGKKAVRTVVSFFTGL